MTRINCVPVETLHNKHLLAEYRELPRVFALARNYLSSNRQISLPECYTMGQGHVTFFYDKLEYLYNRQIELICELKLRNFNITHSDPAELIVGLFGSRLWNNWQPTQEAIAINQARINERLQEIRK